jgi:hypothetical protein
MYILKNGKKTNVSLHGFGGIKTSNKVYKNKYNTPLWLIILLIILIFILFSILLYIQLK